MIAIKLWLMMVIEDDSVTIMIIDADHDDGLMIDWL
jgi:hypothetical protein